MTVKEFRNHETYKTCIDRIKNYKHGKVFTVPFYKIPTKGQKNGITTILRDCMEDGLIESISVSLDLTGNITEETYRRTNL